MAENYTFTEYLGASFQQKFLWQLLTEPEFSSLVFPHLKTDYWDDINYKRYFILLKNYYDEYGKVPNLQNKSIYHAITKFKNHNDSTDEDILLGITDKIKIWNESVINKNIDYDGDAIQKATFGFVTQGEYADLAGFILGKLKNGQLDENTLVTIEEKIKKIGEIGVEDNDETEIFDDIDDTLTDDFRNPIPTGIVELDRVMEGGLGRGEIGILLAPSGIGKTTFLTKVANHAHFCEKNVLQLVFEDTKKEIKRKHYAIWSEVGLSEMRYEKELVRKKIIEKKTTFKGNKLIIKRMSQEDTTIPKIRKWLERYKKKTGITFDLIVLDYIDCVEPHKNSTDQNQSELTIIKAFESMANELDIPCWTAIQTNRSGFGVEFVTTEQMGGNIKRAQKTHFLMSVTKSDLQKEAGLANVKILKARFAKDGQSYQDVIFNNNSLVIDFPEGSSTRPREHAEPIDERAVSLLNREVSKLSENQIEEFDDLETKDGVVTYEDLDVDNILQSIENGNIDDNGKDYINNLLNDHSRKL